MIRRASRFSETGRPVAVSNTTTATGEVLTSASRSVRGAPLVTVGARMGDRRGRLRGEQQQDLLVPVREGRPAFLLHEVEIADMHPAMAQRRALEGLRRQDVGREAERADIGGHVGDAQGTRQVAEELEELRPVGPFHHGPVFFVGEARGDEVLGLAGLVDGGDGPVARAGQRPGALHDLVEHGLKIEARADAQERRGPGRARAPPAVSCPRPGSS